MIESENRSNNGFKINFLFFLKFNWDGERGLRALNTPTIYNFGDIPVVVLGVWSCSQHNCSIKTTNYEDCYPRSDSC